jgi:glycosyltransferase involved in cell wall biosynthesis
MNIVQITPGAGAMFCGNCVRDNALVAELRRQGHDVTMVPLYLPITLDEEDQSADTPVFFGGINVYLEQKSSLFNHTPKWLHRLFSSQKLLKWASGRTAKTRAADVGDITLSMLRGEEGRQLRELKEMVGWMKTQPRPDVVCLSNALLVGMARRIKSELHTKVICTLQGEDGFLDGLPPSHRADCWKTLIDRASDVDLYIAPSKYFADVMLKRMKLREDQVKVVYNGITLDGYKKSSAKTGDGTAPVLGFFARMCREKGLDTLVDAYITLKKRNKIPRLKLHVGGSCGPSDQILVTELRKKLAEAGCIGEVAFFPNLSRAEKLDFLSTVDVFSVPALYGEAFGLYVIESLAAGVPVVQPRAAAFPELVEATSGGVLCEPGNPESLADAIEGLLQNPARLKALGELGQKTVFEEFSAEAMANRMLEVYAKLTRQESVAQQAVTR